MQTSLLKRSVRIHPNIDSDLHLLQIRCLRHLALKSLEGRNELERRISYKWKYPCLASEEGAGIDQHLTMRVASSRRLVNSPSLPFLVSLPVLVVMLMLTLTTENIRFIYGMHSGANVLFIPFLFLFLSLRDASRGEPYITRLVSCPCTCILLSHTVGASRFPLKIKI
jgi:hypothetical protein